MDAKKILWSLAGAILYGLGYLAGNQAYGEAQKIWTSGHSSSPDWILTFLRGYFFGLAWIWAGHWEQNSATQPVPRSHKFIILAIFYAIGYVFADAFAAWFGVAHHYWLISLLMGILYGVTIALGLVGFPYLAERVSLFFNASRNKQSDSRLNIS